MKSIASVMSIIALGFGLLSCSGGGGGGGGSSTSTLVVSTTAANFGVVGNAYTSTLAATGGTPPLRGPMSGGVIASRTCPRSRHRCRELAPRRPQQAILLRHSL